MKITWSVPVFRERLGSGRGDLVRALALIEALRRDGHDVRVAQARNRPGGDIEETLYGHLLSRILPSRARLVVRDAARWWRSRDHGRRIAAAALEQGADVLVETQVHGVVSGPLAARATGLPLVLDDVSPPSEADRLGTGLPGLGRRVFRSQCRAASLLVAPTHRIREVVLEAAPGVPEIRIVPNGVDPEAHRGVSRETGRRTVGLRDELAVGFVGSFQPWHDVPLLVRAFAAVDLTPLPHLVLVGDGPGRKPALTEARELAVGDRVHAPGTMPPDRIPEFLAACDIGVLAGTNAYGHPMKLLEYAAAGLPVVAPDVPPVREMLDDGASGILVSRGRGSAADPGPPPPGNRPGSAEAPRGASRSPPGSGRELDRPGPLDGPGPRGVGDGPRTGGTSRSAPGERAVIGRAAP